MKLWDKGVNSLEEKIINELVVLAKNHDEEAMETLLREFKPKVIAISREYFLIGAEFDDLIQEGMLGLNKAINAFEFLNNESDFIILLLD